MKHMIQLDPNKVPYDDGEATRTDGKRYEIAVALRQREEEGGKSPADWW
jgi:hypothetical protein